MGYSYANNEYTFETFKERNFPNNVETRHSITFGSAYSFNDVKVSTGLSWNSGLPTTRPIPENPIIGDQINYQDSNSSRLDKYFRLDISATYDFQISKGVKAHTGVSVWNIIDKKNVINDYYQINQQDGIQKVEELSLSITPNATFRVSF